MWQNPGPCQWVYYRSDPDLTTGSAKLSKQHRSVTGGRGEHHLFFFFSHNPAELRWYKFLRNRCGPKNVQKQRLILIIRIDCSKDFTAEPLLTPRAERKNNLAREDFISKLGRSWACVWVNVPSWSPGNSRGRPCSRWWWPAQEVSLMTPISYHRPEWSLATLWVSHELKKGLIFWPLCVRKDSKCTASTSFEFRVEFRLGLGR